MPDASRDPNTLHMSRVFDATSERVFDAWVRQDHFVQWMCPPGVEVTTCEIDVRPGGAWRVGGRHGGDRVFASSGKYLEVKRAERLSFTWAHHADGDFAKPRGHETVVRIKFRAMGNKTEMALVHGAFTDGYAEHSRGWDGSFDKLETFLRRAA